MKNSLGAYRMMKALFKLIDNQSEFCLRDRQLTASRKDQKTFQYLKDAGYIKKTGDKRFCITELTQINFLKELVSKRKPDGKLRVVMFDIPEKYKRNRNFFRRHLVELGFKMKQQSVWVSESPCEDLVGKVVKYHKLGKYVELVVGEIVLIK